MFNNPYKTEREGQIEFFDNYDIPYNDDASVLVDNTDGVYNGNLLEFKLNISNLNKVLFQAIKYLSKMRIKGESVPATILLVALDATTIYLYKSQDYFDAIHQVYTGAASKDNEGFVAGNYNLMLDYSDEEQSAKVRRILKGRKKDPDEMYMPVDIDENCIVGWAERYYRENPKASKGDFLGDDTGTAVKVTGEIRNPRHFAGLINPYQGKSNEKFKYLMDCLNDRLSKKDLGAFYTPIPYAKKAAELVQMAVDRVPEGNDYIILDRCAGSGNLESALIGLTDRNGDELIEHCVVSTYEYYEYKVLSERIGDKVREIIPPTEANVVYENGKVANADAMSKDFINNPIIKQYVDDPNCTIILFENPPYFDSGAITYNDGDTSKRAKAPSVKSFIKTEFMKEIGKYNAPQAIAKELSNLFIWSGFKYYVRQEGDAYIVFSPVKYFKNLELVKKKMVDGYAFNRKYFHATDSVISCVLWLYEEDCQTEEWTLKLEDIDPDNTCRNLGVLLVKKSKTTLIPLTEKRIFHSDVITSVVCNADGTPIANYQQPKGKKPLYNDNSIAYMETTGYTPDAKHRNLVRANMRRGVEKCLGFHVRSDMYLKYLPLWCAKMFPQDNWYDKDVYNTTSDGGDAYTHDPDFLKSCLIYTCLSNQNKCLSFTGSDGRYYRNELCFDTTHGDTCASEDYKKMTLDTDEKRLLDLWDNILDEAKKTAKYNPSLTYGVYQITKELNTSHKEGSGRAEKTVYDYPSLNGDLEALRVMLKAYYKSHITEKMFKHELLK